MAVTHVTNLRNALAQATADFIQGGGSPNYGRLEIRDSTTPLVSFDFQDPPFGSPNTGVITLQGTPIEAQATGDGDADNAIIYDASDAAAVMCSVTATGMGGDIEVSNTNIATDQECSLDSLTYEAAP